MIKNKSLYSVIYTFHFNKDLDRDVSQILCLKKFREVFMSFYTSVSFTENGHRNLFYRKIAL